MSVILYILVKRNLIEEKNFNSAKSCLNYSRRGLMYIYFSGANSKTRAQRINKPALKAIVGLNCRLEEKEAEKKEKNEITGIKHLALFHGSAVFHFHVFHFPMVIPKARLDAFFESKLSLV